MYKFREIKIKLSESSVTLLNMFSSNVPFLASVVNERLKAEVPWSVGQSEAGGRKLGPRISDFTSSALPCITFLSLIHFMDLSYHTSRNRHAYSGAVNVVDGIGREPVEQ